MPNVVLAIGNCRERPIQVAVSAPRRNHATAARIGFCQCGNTSAFDGYCRKCRPTTAKKPKPKHRKRQRHNEPRPKHGATFKIQSYSKRNEILTDLGFESYSSYLLSERWKSIRSRVLTVTPLCLKCGEAANQVHHATYTRENLSGESEIGLFSICGTCHQWAEFDEAGNKLPLHAANKRLGIRNKVRHRPKTKAQRREIRDNAIIRRKVRRRSACPRCGMVVLHEGRLCSECVRKSGTEKPR